MRFFLFTFTRARRRSPARLSSDRKRQTHTAGRRGSLERLEARTLLAADLAVSAVQFEPNLIEVGDSPTRLSYRLSNNGPDAMTSSPVLAEFFLSSDTTFGDADDVKLGQRSSTHTIPPGAFLDLTVPSAVLSSLAIPLNQPPDDYYLFTRVNHGSGSTQTDTNPSNNFARTATTFRVSNDNIRADLAVSAVLVSPNLVEVGSPLTSVSYRLSNNGPVAMSNRSVLAEFFLSSDTTFGNADDVKLGQRSSSHTIPVGAFVDVTVPSGDLASMTIPLSQPAGDYYVFVNVNHNSTLIDSSLGNNRARTASTIRVSNSSIQADLEAAALQFAPSVIEVGASPTGVSYQVSNNGPATMTNSPVLAEFFLSTDTIFGDSDDLKMGEVTLTHTIAPGALVNVTLPPAALSSLTVPLGAAATNYFVFVRVTHGAGSVLTDPSLGDNRARTANTIRVGNESIQADLAVPSLGFVPNLIDAGAHPTNVFYRLRNNGPANMTSSQTLAEFFLSTDTTLGDADDVKIGERVSTHTIPAGLFTDVTLSSADLQSLTIPAGLPAGFYHVFVSVVHGAGSTLADPDLSNNAVRAAGRIQVLGPTSISSPGVYAPVTSTFFLRNSNTDGVADVTFNYGPGGQGWLPIVGDWNDDGGDTAGVYDPDMSTFYLRNSNTDGPADVTFNFGPRGQGWLPLVGDWNGDERDTAGVYNPDTSTFFFRNSNTDGPADVTFNFGPGGQGWLPLVGDWDGDGRDTAGVYNPDTSTFFFRNSNTDGPANVTFNFGPRGQGWLPLVGDWNDDGRDTAGVYNPDTSTFYLRNSNTDGPADVTFNYGPGGQGWRPIVGDWNGTGSPLLAAAGADRDVSGLSPLTAAAVKPVLSQAVTAWTPWIGPEMARRLSGVNVVVTDLPGAQLGWAELDTIYLDYDAAGHGWFVDPTPAVDEEFQRIGSGEMLLASDPAAAGRIDLLTVVEHELGHVLGLDDLDALAGSLMSSTLERGVRYSTGVTELDALFASYGATS